jgi:hypothetical protein
MARAEGGFVTGASLEEFSVTRLQRDTRDIRRATANILAVYLDAPELTQYAGRVWYAEERDRCADFARWNALTLAAVAGACAAISPGMRWDWVLASVRSLLSNPEAKVATYCREFVARAVRCLRGEDPDVVLSGPKVRAFYGLLSGTALDGVVIDGHAWNIARGVCATFRDRPGYTAPLAGVVTARRYRIAVAAYQEAAEVLGEVPHAVQATAWVHWKNIYTRAAREPGED